VTDELVIAGEHGTVTVTAAALTQVVVQAAEAADGARVRRPRRGLEIALGEGGARVQLELAARFGAILPELARDVQARVAEALSRMCGLDVRAVDVSIDELEEAE
jgi:uncharacterized alkaline shock family protein YloU